MVTRFRIPSCLASRGPTSSAFPFALGAFLSGGLAAAAMLFLTNRTGLKTDTIIGLIFTSFFGLGLFLISIYPTSVSIQTITMGNILAISPEDTLQLVIIGGVSAAVLLLLWKDLMVTFFDEAHARTIGLKPDLPEGDLLHAPLRLHRRRHADRRRLPRCRHGRDARRHRLPPHRPLPPPIDPGLPASAPSPRFTGAYLSYFLDGATGGVIVLLQTALFATGLRFRPETRPPRRESARAPSMIDALLQPFQFPFMQNAFLDCADRRPALTALLSCFLVLKGWALMGDAVSHAVLPGIVLALHGGPAASPWGLCRRPWLGSLLTGWLADNSRIKRDTVMGVVFSAMFALGIVLHTAFPTDVHLDHILFGNMLGVGRAET